MKRQIYCLVSIMEDIAVARSINSADPGDVGYVPVVQFDSGAPDADHHFAQAKTDAVSSGVQGNSDEDALSVCPSEGFMNDFGIN